MNVQHLCIKSDTSLQLYTDFMDILFHLLTDHLFTEIKFDYYLSMYTSVRHCGLGIAIRIWKANIPCLNPMQAMWKSGIVSGHPESNGKLLNVLEVCADTKPRDDLYRFHY